MFPETPTMMGLSRETSRYQRLSSMNCAADSTTMAPTIPAGRASAAYIAGVDGLFSAR